MDGLNEFEILFTDVTCFWVWNVVQWLVVV